MYTQFLKLACSIILQALRDIQSNNMYADEAREWLKAPIAQEWLEALGVSHTGRQRIERLSQELLSMPRITLIQHPAGQSADEKRERIRKTMQQRYKELGSPFDPTGKD